MGILTAALLLAASDAPALTGFYRSNQMEIGAALELDAVRAIRLDSGTPFPLRVPIRLECQAQVRRGLTADGDDSAQLDGGRYRPHCGLNRSWHLAENGTVDEDAQSDGEENPA